MSTMECIAFVRRYLDKLQKRSGVYYTYSNEDLIKYLTPDFRKMIERALT